MTCFPSISRALRVSSGNVLRPPLTSSLRKHSGQKPRARQEAWPGYGAIPCTLRAVTGQIPGAAGHRRRVRPWTTGKKCRSRPGGAYAPIPGRRPAPGRREPGELSAPGGSPPPDPAIYGLAAPSVLPPCCLRGTRQDLPCTSAGGTPHPEFGPLNPVTSGLPRSFPGTSPRRSGGRDRAVGKVQRILAELRAEDGLQRVPVQGQE